MSEKNLRSAGNEISLGSRLALTAVKTNPAKRWTEDAWRITAVPLLLLFLLPIVMLFTRTSPAQLLAHIGEKTVLQAMSISLKTTLISLISGTLAPSEGEIVFRDKSINHLPAFRRARRGLRSLTWRRSTSCRYGP